MFETLKNDFLLGSVVFHSFFHLVIEGYLFSFLDHFVGTELMTEYNQAAAIASHLFVTDASERMDDDRNGLVINRGDGVPLPKALFAPPYTVHEVQAMNLWEHIEKTYAAPAVRRLLGAVVLCQFGSFCMQYIKLQGHDLGAKEVCHASRPQHDSLIFDLWLFCLNLNTIIGVPVSIGRSVVLLSHLCSDAVSPNSQKMLDAILVSV